MADRISVYEEGKSKALILTSADHIATGGEGAVYARGNQVFKIYLAPEKAIRAGIPKKLAKLKELQHPCIASPTSALVDKNGDFIGLALPRVDGEALCRLFTNSWRDQNQFGNKEAARVVKDMQEVVAFAHSRQALLVDSNEMNWLVQGLKPVAIDVDSWQLPGFPATAIMPSIRDPLATKGFTEQSDWFAWAIVSFQLWTGIHPYKGIHPSFSRGALQERMEAGVSVFNREVRTPAATRDKANIPSRLLQWYEGVFESKDRSAPPVAWDAAVPAQTAPKHRVVQTGSSAVVHTRLGNAGGKIAAGFNGFVIARTNGGLVLWNAETKSPVDWVTESQCQAVLNRKAAVVRVGATEALVELGNDDALCLYSSQGRSPMSVPTRATRIWQSGNRVFLLGEGHSNGLQEVSAAQLGDRILVSAANAWPVSILSATFMLGCFVQDCLGAPFIGVLEGNGIRQLRAPALKAYKVVQGLGLDADNVWLSAVRKSDGESVRLHLAASSVEFALMSEEITAEPDLNGARLNSGVGVLQLGPDLRVSKGPSCKVVPNAGLSPRARLFSLGASLGLFEDSEVSQLRLQ
ncbi:hypothetical protein LC612_36955 [Nostoc sp. CHAB 5834]|nr:hypothetical protein [Nostoc sp. CHAB 5834]